MIIVFSWSGNRLGILIWTGWKDRYLRGITERDLIEAWRLAEDLFLVRNWKPFHQAIVLKFNKTITLAKREFSILENLIVSFIVIDKTW